MPTGTRSSNLSNRLPGTPKDVWLSGWCTSGGHVGEKFFRGAGYPVCSYELPNPTWLRTLKCGCSCHWSEHGKITKDKQVGSRPDLMPKPPSPPPEKSMTRPAARKPGELEQVVKKVCDDWITGVIELRKGQALTPVIVASILADEGQKCSSGAIAGIFQRWLEYGFAVVLPYPTRFEDYTDQGREQGLETLKRLYADRKHAERFS